MMTEIDGTVATGGLTLGGIVVFVIQQWFAKMRRDDKDASVHGANTSATIATITNLQSEAKKWETRHDELQRQHEEHTELISLLRSQNAMLRLILIQKGVTVEELTAIGVVP